MGKAACEHEKFHFCIYQRQILLFNLQVLPLVCARRSWHLSFFPPTVISSFWLHSKRLHVMVSEREPAKRPFALIPALDNAPQPLAAQAQWNIQLKIICCDVKTTSHPMTENEWVRESSPPPTEPELYINEPLPRHFPRKSFGETVHRNVCHWTRNEVAMKSLWVTKIQRKGGQKPRTV
jgi:hypothetical protein